MDFIEDIETSVERDYARETAALRESTELENEERVLREKMNRDCRLLFRQNVSGRAETWYNRLGGDVRKDRGNCARAVWSDFVSQK